MSVGDRVHDLSLTPADRVTLARAGLLVVVAALVLLRLPTGNGTWSGTRGWVLLALAVPMLVLDGVDGAVARRTGVTGRGARFDMETDAAAVLVLSLAAAPEVGWWVLLAGAMRYLFALAGRFVPALRGPLRPSTARRVVAAVQGPALLVAVLPPAPAPVAVACCAAALLALLWSFGRDVANLWRHAYRGLP